MCRWSSGPCAGAWLWSDRLQTYVPGYRQVRQDKAQHATRGLIACGHGCKQHHCPEDGNLDCVAMPVAKRHALPLVSIAELIATFADPSCRARSPWRVPASPAAPQPRSLIIGAYRPTHLSPVQSHRGAINNIGRRCCDPSSSKMYRIPTSASSTISSMHPLQSMNCASLRCCTPKAFWLIP